jgi:hypothetical protein
LFEQPTIIIKRLATTNETVFLINIKSPPFKRTRNYEFSVILLQLPAPLVEQKKQPK